MAGTGEGVGGGSAAAEVDQGAPAPAVDDGGEDAGAGQAGFVGDAGPGFEGAFDADAGAATAVGPPRQAGDEHAEEPDGRQRR